MEYKDNRRVFIKKVLALGMFVQVPSWYSCDSDSVSSDFKILTKKQQDIFSLVMEILFPYSDGVNVKQLKTLRYLDFVLFDDNYDVDEQSYLLDGVTKLEQLSVKKTNKSFLELSGNDQKKMIEIISGISWGEYWLSRLLTIIFESLLLDPIYNVNVNKIGWHWLQHKNGLPRPNSTNKYNIILKRKNENFTVSKLSQL
jgi:hypothetical protein